MIVCQLRPTLWPTAGAAVVAARAGGNRCSCVGGKRTGLSVPGDSSSVTEPYTRVLTARLRNGSVPVAQRLLYAVLLSYDWRGDGAYPSEKRLAADLGYTERQIRRLLQGLQKRGWLKTEHRGRTVSNKYHLNGNLAASAKRTYKSAKPDTNVRLTGHSCPSDRTSMSAEVDSRSRYLNEKQEVTGALVEAHDEGTEPGGGYAEFRRAGMKLKNGTPLNGAITSEAKQTA